MLASQQGGVLKGLLIELVGWFRKKVQSLEVSKCEFKALQPECGMGPVHRTELIQGCFASSKSDAARAIRLSQTETMRF